MYYWLTGLVLAVCSALIWPALPSPFMLFWLCSVSLALAIVACRSIFLGYYTKPLLFISGAMAGVVLMASFALPIAYWSWQFSAINPSQDVDHRPQTQSAEHSIKGRVLTLQVPSQGKIKFNLQIQHLNGQAIPFPWQPRVILSWYHPNTFLQQGDEITATVKLKPNHGAMNVGSFNYQRWLWSQGISGSAYIKELKSVKKQPTVRALWFESLYEQFKQAQFSQSRPMVALLFAYKDFSETFWQQLRQFGLSHLFAISGLHIGMAAGFSYLFMTWCCRCLVYMYFFIYRQKHQAETINSIEFQAKRRQIALKFQFYLPLLVSLMLACAYAALAGFAITTLRAVIALLLIYAVRIFELPISRTQLLLLCLAGLLFISPLAIFSSGFWLSIVAVAVIFYSLWRFETRKTFANTYLKLWFWLVSLVRLQLLFLILMLPLQIYFFSGMSYFAPIANLIAVPLFSLVLIPLLFIASLFYPILPDLALSLFSLVDSLLTYFWQLLSLLPEASGWLDINPQMVTLAVLMVCLLLMLQLPLINRRWLLSLFTFIGIITITAKIMLEDNSPYWQASVLDVDQGLAVVVEQNNHRLLYDTGAKYPSGFSWAKRVVEPYLEYSAYENSLMTKSKPILDFLVISHSDNDHSGGINFILNEFNVGQFISGESEITGGLACREQTIEWGTLALRFFPGENQQTDAVSKPTNNNRSCTLLLSDGRFSLILTGDIEKKQEHYLVQTYGEQLKANVIVAPHHGSNTSSSSLFIDAVAPTVNIFSSGFNNRWGFPAPEVVQRYQNNKVISYNTAEEGMLVIHFKNGINVTTYRKNIAPYWYNQNTSWPGW